MLLRNQEKKILQWKFNNFLSRGREWEELTLTNKRITCVHVKRVEHLKRVKHTMFDIPLEDVVNVFVEKEWKMPAKLIVEVSIGQIVGQPKIIKRFRFDANKKVVHDWFDAIQKASRDIVKITPSVYPKLNLNQS